MVDFYKKVFTLHHMKLKPNDKVTVNFLSVGEPNVVNCFAEAVVISTHTYPDGTEIVSLKGGVNGWAEVNGSLTKIVK